MPRFLKIAALCIAFIIVAGASAFLTLTLIIKSPNTVVVPDLVGKDTVYALETLTGLGLNTKIRESAYSREYSKNQVIFQDPEPGSEIKKGRDVKIRISKGSRKILTPNLKGLAVRQARIILEENDLCMGKLSASHANIKKDEIFSQSPMPGSEIDRETCVDLLVSMGNLSKTIIMPNLNQLSLDDAIFLIEMNNLTLGEITSRFQEDAPKDIVLDQKPLSGHRVIERSLVNLVRNRKTNIKSREYITEGGCLFRHRIDNGFIKKHIRVKLNSSGLSNDIFNDFIKPGKEIWLIIPNQENATVTLYEDDELIRTQSCDSYDTFNKFGIFEIHGSFDIRPDLTQPIEQN